MNGGIKRRQNASKCIQLFAATYPLNSTTKLQELEVAPTQKTQSENTGIVLSSQKVLLIYHYMNYDWSGSKHASE